jgi:hypothetical protein
MKESCVLSRIDELEISGDIDSEAGNIFLVRASIEKFGRRKYKAEVSVGDCDLLNPNLINIRGISFTTIGGFSRKSNNSTPCHRIEWALDLARADPEDVQRTCRVGLRVRV